MKRYRLFHRVQKTFQDIQAASAQEACQQIGWLIGDTWVREETQGKYANGWRNITRRKVNNEPTQSH